ncbi:MAG: 23S rRNA (cytosine(2499)-C(5))-methyltransferase [Verrucomicrobia bacterium]|nr:MAG: 23S rRNA (cytosine(2499)-C(5))-methyltransferase [Verrucomicrobiota bacterium]
MIRSGHPWLYADSIREQNREAEPGELAVIYDRKNKFLAVGLFDRDSPLRVRVLHAGKPVTIDSDWWQTRLEQALTRRRGLFDEQTTGYRCVNGESDGWPGLVLDRYDATLVLKLYTVAWLPRLEEIVRVIRAGLKPERIVLRLSRNIQATTHTKFNLSDGEFLIGDRRDAWPTFLETGLRFEADVLRGQKTGFFLDQRENRRIVESLARGRDVLNVFSFSGGFSVYAARGGAKSVTDLDISAHALESAKRNFALNENQPTVARCRHETVQADAFEWLAGNESKKFDLIILDPPSLARREAERAGAIQAYGRLAQSGLAHLRPGGVLVAASCSAHVSAEEFFGALRLAAKKSRRKFTELQTTGHAPDHPATFPEVHYLKCIYLKLCG